MQQPGCFGGLGALRLSISAGGPAAGSPTGRSVTRVADNDLAEQARRWLEQASICAKPNAILKLTETVTQVYVSSPWHWEKDVAGILGHSTEKDDQPVRELAMISTKAHTRMLARTLHGLKAVEATRLWEHAGHAQRRRAGQWVNVDCAHEASVRLVAGCSLHDVANTTTNLSIRRTPHT